MSLLSIMDAIAVHAAAAAITAGGTSFTDVAVGFPASKGRCVRIFYGGERPVMHFFEGRTLNSRLMAQAIIVRAYWPLSETATKRQRVMEGEMGSFIDSLRTRILGDSQLGSAGSDLEMSPAAADQGVVSGVAYSYVDTEIVVDYNEYTIVP